MAGCTCSSVALLVHPRRWVSVFIKVGLGAVAAMMCWQATGSESSATASSSDDPRVHMILATQRRLQDFFWTSLSLLDLRFQMLFWATWCRGEARPLGGKCDILWSSSTHLWLYKNYPRVRSKGTGDGDAPSADQGAVSGRGARFPSPCLVGECPLLFVAYMIWGVL